MEKVDQVFQIVSNFLQTDAGKMLVRTTSGAIANKDANYAKAILTAELLAKIIGAAPVIDEVSAGRYRITWEGAEQEKATAYFKKMAIDAVKPKIGEPEKGFFVDFFPVLKPLALIYGGGSVAGIVGVSALAGFIGGKLTK